MIQVACPEPGIYMECGHDKTDWQIYSSSFKPLTKWRTFWESGQRIEGKPGVARIVGRTYRKPKAPKANVATA